MSDRSDAEERWSPPIGPVDPEHPPECAAVIAEVWTLLDGECTPPETRDKLRHHLEECPPTCLRHYGVEERVKNLIAQKCGGERAPDSCVSGCASRSAAPRSSAAASWYQALGRLPWLALECLRSRFLRPRLAMMVLHTVGGV